MINNKFNTSIVTLRSLENFKFSIPTYQRPYVWGNEQIKKLLDDIYESYRLDCQCDYFIGTILTKENGNVAELIDGQQRFTTLWLIAFIFKQRKRVSELKNFLQHSDGSLRLGFEIRTEIEDYLRRLLDSTIDNDVKIFTSDVIVRLPYLKNIAEALTTITGLINQVEEDHLDAVGNYIYNNVKIIKNTTPEKIDLNKLFSTINSAGVQLEQTDIVKAKLLALIDDKVTYGKLWESCENMNDFFERNLRNSFPKTNWHNVDLSNFISFNPDILSYKESDQTDLIHITDFSIAQLVNETLPEYNEIKSEAEDEKRESEEVHCRSIISFSQLLLHTYRLHLKREGLPDFEGTFHAGRLIEIFDDLISPTKATEIQRFLELLFEVRYLFDKYIVKWISDSDTKTEHLELVTVKKQQGEIYYSRSKVSKGEMLMLQSVLYFTGDYLRQYWLTSYLGYLHSNHCNLKADDNRHLMKLENFDNQLSLCRELKDKEASLVLLNGNLPRDFKFEGYLKSAFGTKFQHYWFQKLEYILYKNWPFDKGNDFENYRITSRNSIEHVYPQNPENQVKNPRIDDHFLHSFGNLVLLNVSQNSEYSNKSVDEKRVIFNNKTNVPDSLKSYYIFKKYNQSWKSDDIQHHQAEMISLIEDHYRVSGYKLIPNQIMN